MIGKRASYAIFLAIFAALLAVLHISYFRLPFHWDELGQFVPAALDLYRDGSWVAHSTLPNVHPPAVMAYLAFVWRLFGYSIASARIAMLAVASLGVLFSFLLAIRLARGTPGAPAFAAVAFLIATPLFYTQSMMALLDMPTMTLTVLALLLFFEGRYGWCAVVCTLLALTKETAITTPAVFAVWLWFRGQRRPEALFFLAPFAALGGWLIVLHHATGHWLGNAEFAQYNVNYALNPLQVLYSAGERLLFLFIKDGRFIGAIALYAGWRMLKGRDWEVAAWVAGAQLVLVTVLGGAVLDRYLLPLLPILYAAFACAACAYPASWRWISQTALVIGLVAGWFWNPPYPFQYEDNLAMIDFIGVQKAAAQFIETLSPDARVASMWPFTGAIGDPEFGYLKRPLKAVEVRNFDASTLKGLDRSAFDVLVVYSRQNPVQGSWIDLAPLDPLLRRLPGYHPQATREETADLGYVPLVGWQQHGQWIEIFAPMR